MAVIVNIRRYKSNEDYKTGTNTSLPELKPVVIYQNPTVNSYNNKTDKSITGEGTTEKPFVFVNDLATVPAHHYYGTDVEENKRGYFPLDEAITQIFNTNNYYNSLTASIYNIVINMMGGFKASYVVETAETAYTQVSMWTTNEVENKIGNFKAVVTIHDTVTDTTWVLQNVLGFDYVGTPVSLDRTVLTDSSLTLALSVNGSNYLQATVNNMPSNVKRVHFCFERCTQKVVFNILTAKTGEFNLVGFEVELQRNNIIQANTGSFHLTGRPINLTPIKYGALYNWYAATDARNIANTGWHVPTKTEAETLGAILGGVSIAGGHLKESGLTHWQSPNTGADNSSGFNGRGSGFRDGSIGLYQSLLLSFLSHTTTAYNTTRNYTFGMNSGSAGLGITDNLKKGGYSIRLICNSSTDPGSYTGNDGKVYHTIKIGTQVWLASNLAETKFRNGDWIPGFDDGTYTPISNAAWTAATSAMMCAYNDNWGNV